MSGPTAVDFPGMTEVIIHRLAGTVATWWIRDPALCMILHERGAAWSTPTFTVQAINLDPLTYREVAP